MNSIDILDIVHRDLKLENILIKEYNENVDELDIKVKIKNFDLNSIINL